MQKNLNIESDQDFG